MGRPFHWKTRFRIGLCAATGPFQSTTLHWKDRRNAAIRNYAITADLNPARGVANTTPYLTVGTLYGLPDLFPGQQEFLKSTMGAWPRVLKYPAI